MRYCFHFVAVFNRSAQSNGTGSFPLNPLLKAAILLLKIDGICSVAGHISEGWPKFN